MSEEYLSSGSAVERAIICPSSVALPHARHESVWNARGTMIHEYLEATSKVGRDAALAQIADDKDRDVCAEIDLTGLEGVLGLAAEVALAYNVSTGTGRELGRGAGRLYDDVGIDELPCTLDVLGVRELPNVRRGFVGDYKAGYQTQRAASEVVQLDFGALAAARTYNLDVVEVQLIQVREGVKPWIDKRVIEGFEIDMFEEMLRDKHAEWKKLRAEYRQGVIPDRFVTGDHCNNCAAREWCPAQSTLVRSMIARPDDPLATLDRFATLTDADLAVIWERIGTAQSALSQLKKRILGIAGSRPINLGTGKPGRERWLTAVVGGGKEKISGEHAFDAIAELHTEEVATAATTVTTTKKQIDAAIGAIAPRGKKAAMLRDLYARLAKTPGAVTTKIGVRMAEIELPIGEQPRLMSRRDDAPEIEE